MRVRSKVIREGAHRFYVRQGCGVRETQAVFVKALRGVLSAGSTRRARKL